MKIKREVKIGLFALIMLLCLYLGVNYLKGKEVFGGDRAYYALYDQTDGLQTSAPVLLRGVKIGSVTGISIDPGKADQVLVTVNIKKSVKIPVDSKLKLFTNGIMGGKAIKLIHGTSESNFEKHAVIPSETESGLLEYASLSIEDIISEVKRVMNSLEATSNSLNNILLQNTDNLKSSMDNINTITGQMASGGLDKTLRDLNHFSSMLSSNSQRFDNIIANLDGITDSLAKADIKSTVDTLGMSISNLNSILANLSNGDGTGGRLLQDPALYDSLVMATGNLSALLDDLKENPKRYVHISLFGKRDKEKKNKDK